MVKNVKKSFLEQERDSFIPRKSKNARAGREGRDLAQDLLPGSEGKAQTLPGFVPSEAPQLPAERRFWIFYFIFFLSCILGFPSVEQPWELSLPHPHHSGFPALRALLCPALLLQLHPGES